MHKLAIAFLSLLSLNTLAAQSTGPKLIADVNYGQLPLSFEANQGQADPRVQFLSRGSGYSLFLTESGAVLALGEGVACHAPSTAKADPCPNGSRKSDVIRMSLLSPFGESSTLRAGAAVGEQELPGKVNYFVGNDPTRWRANLPTYAKVRYSQVYPGVDLLYYGNQRQLEYDFVVAPGASAEQIRLRFEGQKQLRIAANGDLILHGESGSAAFHKPVVYQEKGGHREPVAGRFELAANNTVRFKLGRYDHTRQLVIDPVLVYSTYLGGSGGDSGNAIAVDAAGHAYVVGLTGSPDFPLSSSPLPPPSGVIPSTQGAVFVTMFGAAGSALIYSSYLGGSGSQTGLGVAIDGSGNAYITGTTNSTNFPVTTGAFQTTYKSTNSAGGNAFVTKLNSHGNVLLYSTYLGGSNSDYCTGELLFGEAGESIAVDAQGNAYVAGGTTSPDFPVTSGAFQTTRSASVPGAPVAFVTKINPSGTALVYSTLLGGSGTGALCYKRGEQVKAIAVDPLGDAYLAGQTVSADFPITSGAFQMVNKGSVYGSGNAFITKLNATGSALVYSTYLGGTSSDGATGLAIDGSGAAYVAGNTQSSDFPTTAGALHTTPYSPMYYNAEGFISKLNPAGSGLEFSTYLGGYESSTNALAVDSHGSSYVTGYVGSRYATTSNEVTPFLPPNEYVNSQAFVAKLNPTGTALQYGTMLASSLSQASSQGRALALDPAGNLYVTGYTTGSNVIVTPSAFQKTNKHPGGGQTAFLSKLSLAAETTDHAFTSIALSSPPALTNQGKPVTLTAQVASTTGTPAATGNVLIFGKPDRYPPSTPFANTTLTLNGTGSASVTTSSLAPGLYNAYAYYYGDATHVSSLTDVSNGQGISFRIVGPPAVLSGPAPDPNLTFTYGHISGGIDGKVTDSSGYALAGVPVTFSGAGILFPSYDRVTTQQGYAGALVDTRTIGKFNALMSVNGISTPLSYLFTVLPAPLDVTVSPGTTARRYGSANPVQTYKIKGLVNGDTVTVTSSTTATPASPVGTYPLTATVSGPAAANYQITFHNGTLTIVKAPLVLVAATYQSTYGQTPPTPTAYSVAGFLNGDTASVISGSPALSTTVTAATPVGYYPIKTQVGSLSATNYTITPQAQAGVLQVVKAPLLLKATNITVHHGAPLPAFTYTLSGFVNGDSQASSVTGAPTISSGAGSNSKPGTYPINIAKGTLVSGNYYFTPVGGVLTVLP